MLQKMSAITDLSMPKRPLGLIRKLCKVSSVLVTLFSLAACSTHYTVDAVFPRPLVKTLPVSADLIFSEEFSTYTYEQTNENRANLSLELGNTQVTLFETMAAQMFSASNKTNRHLQLTPSIEDVQYAIPRESRAEIYEIWLKYRLLVSDSNGAPIADWLITGYGKTPTAFMKSAQEAIGAATDIALRDIGSQLSIGFSRQPDIQAWLGESIGDTPAGES